MIKDLAFSPLSRTLSKEEETIAAISTPFGESGIGIVRMSGSSAEAIARKLFRPKGNQAYLVSHHFHYGEIVDNRSGKVVDEVLVVLMKSPKTYTREDMVEIHCHGGYLVLQRVLELVTAHGARMALPGEFTKRAFLNGRIDLTQAEAVIDLIKAKSMAGLEIANQQLKGSLYREMTQLKTCLIQNLALIEAHIDFPEEEIPLPSLRKIGREIRGMVEKLRGWIATYEEGKIFREGVSCAIVGKTNVGKSSLLNILLREERAIVTPVPGTTRDVIEEVVNICGIPVRLIDTAGLRRTRDCVEREGVRRTKERLSVSDFILLVLDRSRCLDEDDEEIFEEVREKRKVIVLNKNDLPQVMNVDEVKNRFINDPMVSASALVGEGIDALKETIHASLVQRDFRATLEYPVVANIRHKNALVQIRDNLSNAMKGMEEGVSIEFISFEIRSALDVLGEMIGETTSEEILNRIFDQFCIGK